MSDRPPNAVQEFHRAGEHLRSGARALQARDDTPEQGEVANAVEALCQLIEVASILVQRLAAMREGPASADLDELARLLDRLRQISLQMQEPDTRDAMERLDRLRDDPT